MKLIKSLLICFDLQFQPRPLAPPPPTPTHLPQQLNSKAAELKARLLKGRERASSTTPTGGMIGQYAQSSPQTPLPAATEERVQNLNDLISQYSSQPLAQSNSNAKKKQSINEEATNTRNSVTDHSAKAQAPSLGSPTKVAKPTGNGKVVNNGSVRISRHPSNESSFEGSEGEIIEDPIPKKVSALPEPKQNPPRAKENNDGQPRRLPPREESLLKLSYTRGVREASPPSRSFTNPQPKPIYKVAPREEALAKDDPDLSLSGGHGETKNLSKSGPRPERRPTQSESQLDRRPSLASNKQLPRREARGQTEEPRPETKPKFGRENSKPAREPLNPVVPTLAQILPYDEDLREWLETTGYHDKPYRGQNPQTPKSNCSNRYAKGCTVGRDAG